MKRIIGAIKLPFHLMFELFLGILFGVSKLLVTFQNLIYLIAKLFRKIAFIIVCPLLLVFFTNEFSHEGYINSFIIFFKEGYWHQKNSILIMLGCVAIGFCVKMLFSVIYDFSEYILNFFFDWNMSLTSRLRLNKENINNDITNIKFGSRREKDNKDMAKFRNSSNFTDFTH